MATANDLEKRREIVFHPYPVGQVEQAAEFLGALPGLVVRCREPRVLEVVYSIGEYTLEELEGLLESQGYHLYSTLLIRLRRALIYYCERVQLENLLEPQGRSRNCRAFVTAWERQPHGDHDETPSEWRQYR